jgi:hypothetical protein
MTRGEFQALFPEFAASTYDARIEALIPTLTELDADKAGARLNYITGLQLADILTMQDITIKYGAAAAGSSTSSSTEKKVGDVSIKSSFGQSASSSSGGGGHAGQTKYGERYEDEVRKLGFGAVAV